MTIAQFIKALPKAELHLHLEGAVPWAMTQTLTPEPLPAQPASWDNAFRFADFSDFLVAMRHLYRPVLTSVAQYHQVAAAVFAGLMAQNVRYVEISLGCNTLITLNLPVAEVITAVKDAAPEGLHVAVVLGFAREMNRDCPVTFITEALQCPALSGIDLHGDERQGSVTAFANLFARAAAQGLLTKAHAGELRGPDSILETLDTLGVNRIEHGVTAQHHPALRRRLAAQQITLDMAVWSNVKLNVVSGVAQHPIRQFLQQGIPVTANTDDPMVFGYSLNEELHSLVEHLGFTPAELAQLQLNAFNVARMPVAARQAIKAEIRTLMSQFAPLPT